MKTPEPFRFNRKKVKAIVLGADPTNKTKKGKVPKELIFAFGIGQDPRYFRDILMNLNRLGLHLEDLYIQNLLPQVQAEETSKNKNYVKLARANAPVLATELNKIDPKKKVPVFITAEKVYRAIMKKQRDLPSCESFYLLDTMPPISANDNLLERPAIPMFRNNKYNLVHWPEYELFLSEIFKR